MQLRPHRRNLVIWNQSAGRGDAPRITCLARALRIRTVVLLTVICLACLARAARARWRVVLPGLALTTVGLALRAGSGGALVLPGLFFLVSAPLTPAGSAADRVLERELSACSTPAERADLEATFDRYPDSLTRELRDILARQATGHRSGRIPGARH